MRQGDPLRLSARRLQWSTWALVGVLAVGLVLASSLEIDEFASGPAVVRVEVTGSSIEEGKTTFGAPGEGGGAPSSCLVIGYLPARHLAAILPGVSARFSPTEIPASSSAAAAAALSRGGAVEIQLESADPHLLRADRIRRHLNDPTTSPGGEAMVAVVGRLDPDAAMDQGRRLECHDGLKGTIEVRIRPRKLISAFIPGSSASSSSGSNR